MKLTTSSVNALSELLDPDATTVVDLPQLQKLCSRGQDLNYMCAASAHLITGIPDVPSWLRPRVWKLVLRF